MYDPNDRQRSREICWSIISRIFQESKGKIDPTVLQKSVKKSTQNLFIRFSISKNNNKQLTGEYFNNILESIGGEDNSGVGQME